MLYHISKTAGLKILKPQSSTHKKPYVYATENIVTGLLFGAPHDDFDFIIDEEDGKPVIMECYPSAFYRIFKDRTCSVYEIAEDGFMRGMTPWAPELVSENEVKVIREMIVEDLYSSLLEEEARGNLLIRRYEENMDYKHIVSEHIIDRLIRSDAVYAQNERLEEHYGKLIDALQELMDGHLL